MSFLSILNLWKHEIKNYLSSWTNNVIITEKYGKLGGFTNDDYQGSSMTKFYGKFLLRASNHVENWPCLAFYVNGNEFGHLGQNLVFFGQNWPFLTLYDKNFKNSYSGPQARWKSGLVLLSRPLFMCFVIRLKFGPFRPKISQLCWGTPTFYWCPRLYLPIGIQNCPCFCWWISSHFWLGSKSQ